MEDRASLNLYLPFAILDLPFSILNLRSSILETA
jgi:hypothetical protein